MDVCFFFFSAWGRGRGSRGVRGFIENLRGGVVSQEGEGDTGGREGVCGEFGGGGLNIFLGGRNAHQDYV